jgi:two-component system cell cycle sensor histidine kinase/response regulator CckA
MELHDLTWIAGEFGLPTLTERPSGIVANRPALDALHDELPPLMELALARLVGLGPFHPELTDALSRGRRGERVSLVLGPQGIAAQSWRVAVTPAGPGYATVMLAPHGMEQAGAVQRRAGLVDVAAAVSHEVANAMSAIGGWAELAGRGSSAGIDPREALQLIASCARTAEQAARRMLSLSRGEDTDSQARTDVSELAGEVTDLLTLSAREKLVTLHAHVEPGLTVSGSRAQLFTVLWNLTKNALEACEARGTVTVTVMGDDVHVHVEVRDTGAGFDKETQERIFQPYYTTKAGGTGLGLALVRDAVQSLEGTLSLESAVGQGTTFRIALPRIHRTSDVHGLTAESVRVSDEAPASGYGIDARVLVVDDDDALREMVATALSLRGARVTTARSAEQARDLEGSFDIALIDMNLDDGRGDDLLAQLRKRGSVNAAMLVTGTVQKPRLVVGGEPDDWLRKPFEISQLVDRLRRTLERHRMLSAATASVRV